MESFASFAELAAKHDVVPLVRERLADFDTPIGMAARLRGRGKFFLLESVEGGEKWGRYSILGFDIAREFQIVNGEARLHDEAGERVLPGNPVQALQQYLASFRPCHRPGLPRFFGGAVGYLSFETVRFFERCGQTKPAPGEFPEAYFMLADHLAIFDNVSHTIKLVCCVHPRCHADLRQAHRAGVAQLDRMEETLFRHAPASPYDKTRPQSEPVTMQSNMSPEAYMAMVSRAKEYIRDGEIIQAVLAQHFSGRVTADHLDVYRALRFINPSPYLFFLDLGEGRAIAGSSPEVMVRVSETTATIRPIAGTRPRGASEADDRALAAELLADPKERAEHVMLVDLARNDLGRIAEIGSVTVTDLMVIERYSHVMHLVSSVQAQVRPEFDALDVFQASFPAGTLSGAPKVRAMEIINELEPTGRGPYGGALGYIAYGGRVMDMAITIRTVLLDHDVASVTAGAGIVHDSVPEREHQECLHKSRGMRRALELAQNGLRLGGQA